MRLIRQIHRFEMTKLIFVYGTLKSGEPNYDLIRDESRGKCTLRGRATTEEKYPLVVASRFDIPYLLYDPGKGHVRTKRR